MSWMWLLIILCFLTWSCSFNVHPSLDALQLAKRRREPRHIIRATSIVIRIPLAFQVQSHVWSFGGPTRAQEAHLWDHILMNVIATNPSLEKSKMVVIILQLSQNGLKKKSTYLEAKTSSLRRYNSAGSECWRHKYSATWRAGNSVSQT